MRLLIATSQAFVLWDRGSITRIHAGRGTYGGITWNERHVFVASLGNAALWDQKDKPNDPDQERILIYDRHLHLVGNVSVGSVDTHAIHWDPFGEFLLVCHTRRDAILACTEPIGGSVQTLWTPPDWIEPPEQAGASRSGRHHINSVWVDQVGFLWTVFRYGTPAASMGVKIGRDERWPKLGRLRVVDSVELPQEAHNLYEHAGILRCIGSFDECLMSRRDGHDSRIPLSAGYPRGIADSRGRMWIGASARGSRDTRHHGTAHIVVVSPDGSILDRHPLPELGQVYCVRALDGYDWAHHGDWGPACPLDIESAPATMD